MNIHNFRSMKGFTEEYNELMAPMLKMSEFSETELYALLVLAYCDMSKFIHWSESWTIQIESKKKVLDPDLPLPEEVMEKAEETRLKVFEELQYYYRNELQLSNYSERLGNLMTVVHEAGVSNYLFKFILHDHLLFSSKNEIRTEFRKLQNWK